MLPVLSFILLFLILWLDGRSGPLVALLVALATAAVVWYAGYSYMSTRR